MNPLYSSLRNGIETTSTRETNELAGQLADIIPANSTLALSGDLGSGKTTLVKGLALAWGIDDTLTSPTYNILLSYNGRSRNLLHMDAYRLNGPDETDALMIEDFLKEPWCLAVEWPEKIIRSLPKPIIHLHIDCSGENSRRFQIKD